MNLPKTKMEWMTEQHLLNKVSQTADELIARLNLRPPIDPLAVAKSEKRQLRCGGSDLGSRYDGKLEYVRSRGLFLLFYNTKYDARMPKGRHHARTRFSISHELGHYFIDHHHQSLRSGAKPHRSLNEFQSYRQVEREADAFAASLLMPTRYVKPIVNESELSLSRINDIAADFEVSLVSASIRSVRLSDFPCALAGIRNGQIAWMFTSAALLEAGLYPNRGILPKNAQQPWLTMNSGNVDWTNAEGKVVDWFRTFGNDQLDEVDVTEEYCPIPVMGTLLALLTIDESDLAGGDDDYEDSD